MKLSDVKTIRKKTLIREKNTAMTWVVMGDLRIVLLQKGIRICESRRKRSRINLPDIYAF
jgi:hypothetical protein